MRKLKRAPKSCTHWIFMTMVTVCHVAVVGVVGYLKFKPAGEDDILEPARKSILHFILVIIALYSMGMNNFCHPGFNTWPVTFVKMYSALYKVLSLEIKHGQEMLGAVTWRHPRVT